MRAHVEKMSSRQWWRVGKRFLWTVTRPRRSTSYGLYDSSLIHHRNCIRSRDQGRPLQARRRWLVTVVAEEVIQTSTNRCGGCGSVLQSEDEARPGFIPREKLLQGSVGKEEDGEKEKEVEEDGDEDEEEDGKPVRAREQQQLTCKRCFSLKHYNSALNVTLQADDYLRHLSHLVDKRALILLVVDVIDFPGSLFPDLHTLVSPHSQVLVVANKIDLLPRIQTETRSFWNRLEDMILDECRESSLRECAELGLVFTSAKSGDGLERLATVIDEGWGNRGDVYLLGCTNVGKSSLFNYLLERLCGAVPGQLIEDGEKKEQGSSPPPAATISHWPGTTLGLLSFPLMSVGKRRRLLAKQMSKAREMGLSREQYLPIPSHSGERNISEMPKNRLWLHDTPGAINNEQLINLLTTKELNLALPKKPLKPKTFILKPGQCMMLGGLARLDYLDGAVSSYFTVFAASYLPVHVTKISKADAVWSNNLGTPLLKMPFGDEERLRGFPPLEPQLVSVTGSGWKNSAADVVLSSAGWVAVTTANGEEVSLMAHTPGGHGVHCRQPSFYPTAVNNRGKRSRNPNTRSMFRGR